MKTNIELKLKTAIFNIGLW